MPLLILAVLYGAYYVWKRRGGGASIGQYGALYRPVEKYDAASTATTPIFSPTSMGRRPSSFMNADTEIGTQLSPISTGKRAENKSYGAISSKAVQVEG